MYPAVRCNGVLFGYLAILLTIILLRPPRPKAEGAIETPEEVPVHWAVLAGIGAVAGWSSGFLGIGGGLAITALMAGLAKSRSIAPGHEPCRHGVAGDAAGGAALCAAGH